MEISARSEQIAVAVLATLYAANVNRDYGSFIGIAEIINPELDGSLKFPNPFENSLMMLADDFFDASWRGFDKVGKLPTLEAKALLEETALPILNGLPVNEDAVQAVFSSP